MGKNEHLKAVGEEKARGYGLAPFYCILDLPHWEEYCGTGKCVGAPLAAPGSKTNQKNEGAASGTPTLGKIIRVFKSISAINANRLLQRQEQPVWQRNYYERIIRNDAELDAVRKYIVENPMKWAEDSENPDNIT
ncbi:MAG TPA: hypothetical protein VMJ66_02415 [Geobacteraceae bacterium]|nr:hypothetical protein [Geobacteraceae bacterium]